MIWAVLLVSEWRFCSISYPWCSLQQWLKPFSRYQSGFILACEQALLFGQVKQVSRERASEWRSREGQRKGELATIPYKFSFVLHPDEGKYHWLKNDVPDIKLIDNRPNWHPLRLCVKSGGSDWHRELVSALNADGLVWCNSRKENIACRG